MAKTAGQTLSFKNKIKSLVLFFAVVAITSCTTIHPNVDLVLAREAFSSAGEVDAAKYSPANYHKAEESYRKGMQFYKQASYKDSVNEFRAAKIYAERAENAARIQRQKTGEEGL